MYDNSYTVCNYFYTCIIIVILYVTTIIHVFSLSNTSQACAYVTNTKVLALFSLIHSAPRHPHKCRAYLRLCD